MSLGGVVTKDSYDSMVEQIIELTKQTLPIDGLFFDIHGAMNVEGMNDPRKDYKYFLAFPKQDGYFS